MKTRETALASLQIRANRLDLVSRLADDVAHELKNPLHAMVINLELLRRRLAADDSLAALERVAFVEDEVRRVDSLVEALMRFVRAAPGSTRAAELDRVLDDIVPLLELVARRARVSLDCRVDGAARIPIAPVLLEQLLLDLALDAIEAMPAGGSLEIRVRRADDHVEIRFSDSRPGPPDPVEPDFGEHAPDDQPGALRLAAAHAISDDVGGRIHTGYDDAAAGATRVLVLPRAPVA